MRTVSQKRWLSEFWRFYVQSYSTVSDQGEGTRTKKVSLSNTRAVASDGKQVSTQAISHLLSGHETQPGEDMSPSMGISLNLSPFSQKVSHTEYLAATN